MLGFWWQSQGPSKQGKWWCLPKNLLLKLKSVGQVGPKP